MQQQSDSTNGVLLAAFLAAIWLVAATFRPTATYHLAPLLVAGVPLIATNQVQRFESRAAATGSAFAIAFGTASLLSIADRLQGPTLLPYGGAYAEAVVFALAGSVVGVIILALRGPDVRTD